MPMMKPMQWLIIMFYSWSLLILFNSMLFFKFNNLPLNQKSNLSNLTSKLIMKW